LPSSFPSLLVLASRAGEESFEKLLLVNANCGGENVHRGAVLGALLGASVGKAGIPERLISGLHNTNEIEAEIESYVAAVLPKWCNKL